MKKPVPPGCPETPIPCATGGLLAILTRPWTMHILWVLGHDGPTRFGVLRRKTTGISSRVLAERLRMLEARGFVYRQYEATIPQAEWTRCGRFCSNSIAWPGFGTKKIAAPGVCLPKRKCQRKIEPRIATHLHSDMNRSRRARHRRSNRKNTSEGVLNNCLRH